MPSSLNADNGVVSGTAGLKSSADSSGVLDLQTNGTTAISISASQVVSFANQPTYTGGTANGVMFLNGSKAVTTGTALVFDGSNLGLGVTPSAWDSIVKVLELNNGVYYGAQTDGEPVFYTGANNYYNASSFKYKVSSKAATRYQQDSGAHKWYNAPSGTAGNAITFTQAMTLDASGNLVVGGTTATLTAANRGNISINGVSSAILSLSVGGVSKGYIYTQGTDIIQNAYVGAFTVQTESSQPVIFGTNNTERVRITSTGVLDLATGAGAVGQIQFPATQVASANANTLDDYEEGTWTPTLVATGSAFSGVAFSGVARYVKIGKVVTFYIGGSFTFSVAGTGDFAIGGLPFTTATASTTPSGGACPLVRFIAWTGSYMSDHCRASTTNVEFWGVANGGSYTRVPCSGLTSGFEIYMSHFYESAN